MTDKWHIKCMMWQLLSFNILVNYIYVCSETQHSTFGILLENKTYKVMYEVYMIINCRQLFVQTRPPVDVYCLATVTVRVTWLTIFRGSKRRLVPMFRLRNGINKRGDHFPPKRHLAGVEVGDSTALLVKYTEHRSVQFVLRPRFLAVSVRVSGTYI